MAVVVFHCCLRERIARQAATGGGGGLWRRAGVGGDWDEGWLLEAGALGRLAQESRLRRRVFLAEDGVQLRLGHDVGVLGGGRLGSGTAVRVAQVGKGRPFGRGLWQRGGSHGFGIGGLVVVR